MAPVSANVDTTYLSTTSLSGDAVFSIGYVAVRGTTDTEEEFYMDMGLI